MTLGDNAESDSDVLRYTYTSLTTPNTTYEVNTRSGERKLLKRERVELMHAQSAHVTP